MSVAPLIQYLRKPNGRPYGVLVAVKRPDGQIVVDFSMCNLKKDKFTKALALQIAVGRANKTTDTSRTMPRSIAKAMQAFNARVLRYYKLTSVDSIVTWDRAASQRSITDSELPF
jgi:hypothetical protein